MTLRPSDTFGALLSEKLAELDAADGMALELVQETAVDRLRLDAQRSVIAIEGGPLPRQGHRAYWTPAETSVEPGQRHLNILS